MYEPPESGNGWNGKNTGYNVYEERRKIEDEEAYKDEEREIEAERDRQRFMDDWIFSEDEEYVRSEYECPFGEMDVPDDLDWDRR